MPKLSETSAVTHRRGAAVTSAIVAATLTLIAERATTEVTVDEVASAAGVNKTTIYRRFPTHADLIVAALSSQAEESIPLTLSGDLRTDLLAMGRRVVTNLESPVGQALLAAGSSTTAPDMVEMRDRFWTQRMEAATRVLTQQPSEWSSPITPEVAIEWFVGPLHFRVVQLGKPVDDAYLEALVDSVLKK